MNNFSHLILTRFNVKVDYGSFGIGLQREWLTHRFSLFEQFCYPSVKGQSNQNFKWLVYFDSETPEDFKNKIKKFEEWSNFLPVFVNGVFSNELNKEKILEHSDINSNYLITTRIDNDDAIHRNFVQIVQDNFIEKQLHFITFKYGYTLHQNKLYSYKYVSNPFLSLVEKLDNSRNFKSVLGFPHTDLPSSALKINYEPAWLQVIHDKNVSNRVKGKRQPISSLYENFSINPEFKVTHEKKFEIFIDRLIWLLKLPLESFISLIPKQLKADIRKIKLG